MQKSRIAMATPGVTQHAMLTAAEGFRAPCWWEPLQEEPKGLLW